MIDLPTALLLALRASAAAAGAAALLTFLGIAPAWVLCRGALAPYRLVLAPLLGWTVLTAGGYLLLPQIAYGGVLAWLVAAAAVANLALVGQWVVWERGTRGKGDQHAWRRLVSPWVVSAWAVSAVVFFVALAPHLHHGALTLLVPNDDDDYFVGLVSRFWAAPAGWQPHAFSVHHWNGWAYHLLLASFRVVSALDDFEAVPIASYLALALAVLPTYVLFRRELRLPEGWSIVGAGLAQLHGLVLWTPGYGFGTNVAAIAAAPLAVLCVGRALRLRDTRSLLLGGSALTLLLTAYTRVSVVPFALVALGVGIVAVADSSPRRWATLRRLGALWLLGALGGGYALYVAVVWGLSHGAARSILDPAETLGAGWGWRDFPKLGAWLGTDSWSLIAPGWPPHLAPLASGMILLGTLAGAGLMLGGVWSIRRRPYRPLLGVLLGFALFLVYARWIKAFPYAVFKVYTLAGFLAVGLCLRGALLLPALVKRSPQLQAVRGAALVLYLAGFGLTSWQTERFYWQPWEPLLRPDALSEAARLARAVPAESRVLVSGSLVVPVALERAGVRDHPIAFHSLWDAQRYGASRVRAALLGHLERAGTDAVGIFEAGVGYRVAPAEEYDYLVVGATEDPRFWGTHDGLRLAEGRVLTLYRRPAGGTLGVEGLHQLLRQVDAQVDPQPDLGVVVSCSGDLAAGSAPPEVPSAACGRASVLLGLLPSQAGPVSVQTTTPEGVQTSPLYLTPGATWYRTGVLQLPAAIRLASEPGLRLYIAGGLVVRDPQSSPPALQRADGGAVLMVLRRSGGDPPSINRGAAGDRGVRTEGEAQGGSMAERELAAGPFVLEARWVGSAALHDLRVALISSPIGAGTTIATDVDVGKPFQVWEWQLTPGQVPAQFIDGQPVPPTDAPPWPAADGQHWVRLRFRRGQQVWLDIPVGYAELRNGQVIALRQLATFVQVPAPEPLPPPMLPSAGTLVKGRADHVFWVGGGVLRWVPSLDVFVRRGFAWGMVQHVDDQVLWRWPVGLPLD